MRKYRNLLAGLIILGICAGCENIPFLAKKPAVKAKASITPSNAVAVIGDFAITSADLNREIDSYNALAKAQGVTQDKIDTREKKVAYLRNEMVRKYMLYQEALDRRLDRNEDISREIEAAKINLLVSELVRQELNKIDVGSKEVEDFYNKNKESLKEPEQRKISEIVAASEDEAKQVYIELLKSGDFAALAKQYSKAPSAPKGGDLGLVALEMDPQKRIRFDKFYEVAFSPTLEVGGVSNIFKGPDGFYIVKLESIKKSDAKPLSELWDNIKAWLLYDKQQKAIVELAKRLSGQTKVEIYEEKIN